MRVLLGLLLVIPMLAQGTNPRAGRSPVSVDGIVLDSSGKPIEGARIDHAIGTPYPVGPTTDLQGRFTVDAEGPAVVIRKPGFESYFLRIDGTSPVRVVMTIFTPWPKCDSAPVRGVKTTAVRDVDYTGSYRVLQTQNGPRALVSGEGPSWSYGMPSTSDIWASVEYVEHSELIAGDKTVSVFAIDARGKTNEGKYWRYQGTFGRSTSYRDVDASTAGLMDRLMGGTCPPF